MNIIIPMGGIGHRFSKDNYRFPKPLINIVGRPMLFWLIDHLDTDDVHDIIYLGLSEQIDKQFDLSQRLQLEYPTKKFSKILLDFETRGAVETLFIVLQSIDEDRLKYKTISLDCDTFYFQSILNKFRHLDAHLNVSFYFEDEQGKPIYSYLKFQENSALIIDLKEKIMISNHANTGAYAFRSGQILKEYCVKLLDQAVGTSGEYYTTNLIKLMIDHGEQFIGMEINRDDFACVGTPDQLNEFLRMLKSDQTHLKVRQMRFCFDLDNTLVTYPTISGDYQSVQPIEENIQLVRELSQAGHYIIIQTARRMKTHRGNIGAVIADIGHVTLETLRRFDIPYNELLFGKPYADVYVDDSAIHALIDTQKEIGWFVDQPVKKRKEIRGFISSRDYHTIEQLDQLIIKSSSTEDLQGEIFFYQNIPLEIVDLFPKFHRIERNDQAGISSLIIEKICGTTFSHLLTNLCLTEGRLNKFLAALKRMHSSLSIPSQDQQVNIYANYSSKIRSRYNQFKEIYVNLDQYFDNQIMSSHVFVDELLRYFTQYEKDQRGFHHGIIHGDPVFSNALLTSDNQVIFLDMRGSLGNDLSLQGDLYYDLGKVYQSLSGYDFILLDKIQFFSQSSVQTYLRRLENLFDNFVRNEYSHQFNFNQLKIITAQFYFTLIPLHNNFEHQIQFYKLALELFRQSSAEMSERRNFSFDQ